jgi:hypothetical protein
MVLMDKMAGEVRKAYLMVWLRASTHQFAIRTLSEGLDENERYSCRKRLKTGRFPARSLLNLDHFHNQPVRRD